MNLDTKDIIESLIYRMPEIRKAFTGLGILSLERKISSINHPEFSNILKDFKKEHIKIISIVGLIQTTFIIEPIKVGRLYPTIIISGNSTEITNLSKTGLLSTISKYLNIRDYLPAPFCRKIIYIENFLNVDINTNDIYLEGVVFSELRTNYWTIDDPLKLPTTSVQKISGRAIINEIILDIIDQGIQIKEKEEREKEVREKVEKRRKELERKRIESINNNSNITNNDKDSNIPTNKNKNVNRSKNLKLKLKITRNSGV